MESLSACDPGYQQAVIAALQSREVGDDRGTRSWPLVAQLVHVVILRTGIGFLSLDLQQRVNF